jgi:hypothetical protein
VPLPVTVTFATTGDGVEAARSRRLAVRDRILRLDPVEDHQAIMRLSGMVDFPWDVTRALEFALFRTFASPRISRLLAGTGEFTERTQARYDDTDLLIASFIEHGYDSPQGRQAIARMNAIHGRFRIRNLDYLYVLSTFVFEPQRWVDRYGWRRFTHNEREAGFRFWREVGVRMGIDDLPDDRRSFEVFNRTYEREQFRYARSNELVARATSELLVSWFLPAALRPLGLRGLSAIMDPPLLDAVGFPHPTALERALVHSGLRARANLQRVLPARRRPVWRTARRSRTYPDGYDITALGPPPPGTTSASDTKGGTTSGP